jgi:hypothetical protein
MIAILWREGYNYRMIETHEGRQMSAEQQDELFAAKALASAAQAGLYVEMSSMVDEDGGGIIYYAMTMDAADHAAKVKEQNRINDEMPFERTKPQTPASTAGETVNDTLPWDIFQQQPTFVRGYATRRGALTASMAKFHEQKNIAAREVIAQKARASWGQPL